MPRVGLSLILAVFAAMMLIGINETGYQRSRDALIEIDGYSRTRADVSRLLQHGSEAYLQKMRQAASGGV